MWEGERGIHRGGIENVCVRVWEGDKGSHRGGITSVCERVWEGERGIKRGEVERKDDFKDENLYQNVETWANITSS